MTPLEAYKGADWGTWRTPDGRSVTMRRRGQRVRFFDLETGEQVGPEQSNVAPAICYAAFNGWTDPAAPAWLNAGLIAEVRRNTSPPAPPRMAEAQGLAGATEGGR